MADSKIEWTDATWNPVRGCTKISPGCAHCYAETFAERFRGVKGHPYEQGFDLRLVPEKLAEPLRWKKPRMVFVNSMSDLFHEDIPDEYIDRVFAVMSLSPQHTFQVLTKRPARMLAYCDPNTRSTHCKVALAQSAWPRELAAQIRAAAQQTDDPDGYILRGDHAARWPLPNVWLGVSVEDQQRANERIPLLMDTPAAVRFLSVEPLLGPVDVSPWLRSTVPCPDGLPGCEVLHLGPSPLHWVIVGGESGAGARPCDVDWVRSIVHQCQATGVPVFVKQLGARSCANGSVNRLELIDKKGGDPAEWPEDLRVRQWPNV